MDLFYTQIKTKLGILHVNATNSFLTSLSWKEKKFKPIIKKINPILKEVKNQINFYMKGKKINFDIPLNPKGTIFQKKVWKNIKKIKWGKITTYKEITNKVFEKKNPLGHRAVGNACSCNPIIILIPCHRIICSNENIGGYNNKLWRKKKLLLLEK
tara:strand:- start:1644 stop:2111 length:468 start_codon:yes stop_codon:yes gene_type:complete